MRIKSLSHTLLQELYMRSSIASNRVSCDVNFFYFALCFVVRSAMLNN